MSGSANVSSIDAIRQFAASLIAFQEEARLCLSVLDGQLRQILFWLERDRPMFWKQEVERCVRDIADARVRLHQCRMRKLGDFRPSCIEEVKDLEKAQHAMEFAQKQIPHVKRWNAEATHEGNEYHGRSSQLVQAVERDIPRLLALLAFTIDRLEAYASVSTPRQAPDSSFFQSLSEEIQTLTQTVINAQLETLEAEDPATELPGSADSDQSDDVP
jgi:hypothetical protein